MCTNQICFSLPTWLIAHKETYQATTDVEAQMRFVIQTSHLNVQQKTGGPFAAAVFVQATGELVSLGVNLVTTQGLSMLHAEIVALSLAQRQLVNYDLSQTNLAPLVLVTSTEPCAMCLGAIPWSGIDAIVTGATDADARAIGFDEGAKPADWVSALTDRGIAVRRLVLTHEAVQVLQEYHQISGILYNT